MILGCAIYYLFTSDIKKKLNLKNNFFREFIDDDLPYFVNEDIFQKQKLTNKTDELIFGIYSIFDMGEFISFNLKSLQKSMKDFLSVISEKVNFI